MKRKIFTYILIGVLLLVASFSGYKVTTMLLEYWQGIDSYDELQPLVQVEPVTDQEPMQTPWPDVNFTALEEINSDVVAWIYSEGTNINYPIVQTTDNDYYLHHLFDGSNNKSGCIFLDCRNSPDFSDTHSILYGHHMKNGTMFTNIIDYKEQEYYDEHPEILLITPIQKYRIEVFAGYVADVGDASWQLEFTSDADYHTWLQNTIKRSYFKSAAIPTTTDRIVTLSTCTFDFEGARFVLVGILREA